MKAILFKPRPDRKKEIDFFKFLMKKLECYDHINENFLLSKDFLNKPLCISKVIKALELNNTISTKKRLKTIEALSILPDQIIVARKIEEVSVDFTIKKDNQIHFIEFHESQHRYLSVSRPTSIYSLDNNKYQVPRFTQRLLKDIWRWENLPNYKIVWWDWFDKNKMKLNVEELLSNNKMEYYTNGKFSFSTTF